MVYVIAEAGSNHDGDLDKAKQLCNVAKECGSDAVKFQLFKNNKLFNNGDKLKLTLFNDEWLPILKKHCDNLGIDFLVTPFDEQSVNDIDEYVRVFKIGSYELTHIPLLRYVAVKGKPVILSTGMANIQEIIDAVTTLRSCGVDDITLLYCTSEYPTNKHDINFSKMLLLKAFTDKVGFSDHTKDVTMGAMAATFSASVIEVHFGLDGMTSPDKVVSLTPTELKEYIDNIRYVSNMETKMSDFNIMQGEILTKGENEERKYRRSIYANRDIGNGILLCSGDIKIVRPEGGLAPREADYLRITVKDINDSEPITNDNTQCVAACIVGTNGMGHISRCTNLCKKENLYPVFLTSMEEATDEFKYVIIDLDRKLTQEELPLGDHRRIIYTIEHSEVTSTHNFTTDECLNPLLDKKGVKKYDKPTIIVSMGGKDEDRLTPKIVDKIKDLQYNINVVIGGQNNNKYESKNNVRYFYNIKNDEMVSMLKRSHKGIILFGVTAYEARKAGLPFICLSSTANRKDATKFEHKGYKHIGKTIPSKEELAKLIEEL